ncbi:DUF4111 domain-containing protein [Calidifontibacter sp. DB0510]|uniref:DUF4111 domain-containing protein n=1 Tax=Metallococcus carri TaxID=1656884 RepID=A0A967EA36_9MICO|nr:aminoglycoside adenylyltransferase domain-containing protein [Metallococcus carri]NHN57047.1 DUF4111 domain-containing protein [Metallococcus carri]NOP39084.1 DUF4111 domain-containing protein [Calidifontibacter sp. DB2511S]
MDLPAAVTDRTTAHLAMLEQRLPGYLTGLYLHGSLCWGEFFPGSDIDFVATTSRRPGEAEIATLRTIHDELAVGTDEATPAYDGFYVLESDLALDPTTISVQPGVLAGDFAVAHHGDASLVTWHELAERGITVAGKPASELDIFTNLPVLQAFSRDNLQTYWASAAARVAAEPDLSPAVGAWCVLGITRLDHLIREGSLTSKSGAGRWALNHLDRRHRPVIEDALAWREAGQERLEPSARAVAVADLMYDVLAAYDITPEPDHC